jgi:hypothetical protein
MVYYQFIYTETLGQGENEKLASLGDVEVEFLEALNGGPLPVAADRYARDFDILVTMGIAVCMLPGSKNACATPLAFDQLVSKHPEAWAESGQEAIYRKFICGKYTFRAFR